MDVGDKGEQHRPVVHPTHCNFPELIAEAAEPGEEQGYGAARKVVVEWDEAWAARRSARYTVDWLRAERRRLQQELRVISEFELTPLPSLLRLR